jgi:hypothetical protein
MKEKKLSTWEILRFKFPENEYVLIEEVSDASGFSRSRSLDYMLINLWNSRGLAVTGIEKKSNRGDWLKELKQPEKQENHFKYCDYFYLLTDKDNVAKLEEIPDAWGWYHINGSQILKTMKPAPKLNPLPIQRSLLCAMMRRAADKTNFVRNDSLEEHIKQKAESIRVERDYVLNNKARSWEDLKPKVDAFEAASGLSITRGWQEDYPKKLGETVKIIMNGGAKEYLESLQRIEKQIKHIHEGVIQKIEFLNSDQDAQECDATDDEQGTESREQK